jgi:hypothetical protein
VGYSRRAVLPIAGGVTVPVPAGVNIALNATALNGSWAGRSIVNGAVGVQAPEIIKMRPIATTAPGPEAIAAPFDATRSLTNAQVALFSFNGTTPRYARITVGQGNGSTLTGRVRLLRGAAVLGTANFTTTAAQIVALLPADDSYTVEVTALTNAPGAYRLQLELLGSLQSETLTLPFDLSKSVPAFTVYRGSFTVAAPRSVWFTYQRQFGAGTTVRVLAADGTTPVSGLTGDGRVQSSVVALPAGTHMLELAPDAAQAASTRVIAQATSWQPVGPALEATTGNNTLIDLVADRNSRPVVGFARAVLVAGLPSNIVMLRRWTGAAWEAAASDLTIDLPCNSGLGSAAFTFDSNNDPVVAYANARAAGSSFVTARRYKNGAWQALGPNDGTLPVTSSFTGACYSAPRLAAGPAGALAIAYRADNDVVLQKFDGSAWVGIETALADSYPAQNNDFDLAADSTGRLHFVLTARSSTVSGGILRRLSTTPTPAWEALGPNGGAWSQTNSCGLSYPKLRFDSNGNPVVGAYAAVPVGSCQVGSTGTAVYRYDGTQWSSTGGFQADSSYVQGNPDYMGFAVSGNDAYVGWVNTRNSQNAPVVQKNTTAGWTAIGGGQGEIPQYTLQGLDDTTAYAPKLLAVGGELYVAVIVVSGQNTAQPSFNPALLRKVAD